MKILTQKLNFWNPAPLVPAVSGVIITAAAVMCIIQETAITDVQEEVVLLSQKLNLRDPAALTPPAATGAVITAAAVVYIIQEPVRTKDAWQEAVMTILTQKRNLWETAMVKVTQTIMENIPVAAALIFAPARIGIIIKDIVL